MGSGKKPSHNLGIDRRYQLGVSQVGPRQIEAKVLQLMNKK